MYTKIHWLLQQNNKIGGLGISARPRGGEWLTDEINQFAINKVNRLVSLLEPIEIRELGLLREQEYCKSQHIHFHHYPIQDRSIPHSRKEFLMLTNLLKTKLDQGENVLIHCRMGIGRASLLAASVLIQEGMIMKEVFPYIQELRGLVVPDTPEQIEWLSTCFE